MAATNIPIIIFCFDDDDDNKGDSADGRRVPFVTCFAVAVSEIKYMLISREHRLQRVKM